MFNYPPQIVDELKERWSETPRASGSTSLPSTSLPSTSLPSTLLSSTSLPSTSLPSDETITSLLEIAYHASFLTEESRRLAFRIIYLPLEELQQLLPQGQEHPSPYTRFVFDEPRHFTLGEIRRLAPATDLTKMLICVEADPDTPCKLHLWGLLDVGASWWKYLTGESSVGVPPPDGLTVSSVEPGNLTVSRQGQILFRLRQGEIVSPAGDALHEGLLANSLRSAKRALQDAVNRRVSREKCSTEELSDEHDPKRAYIRQLERLVFFVRQRFHGGTLLVVPDKFTADDPRIKANLSIKYPAKIKYAAERSKIWKLLILSLAEHARYNKLHRLLGDATGAVGKEDYQDVSRAAYRREELEQMLLDSVQSVAALSGVDGAIVITDRLRLLGFGAEVSAQPPNLQEIVIAQDASASNKTDRRSIETYGTRHRSAFRFCFNNEGAVALVVSQDGEVKAVKQVGRDVIMWPDIHFRTLGL